MITVKDANLKEKRITLNGSSYSGIPISIDGSYTLKVDASDLSGNRSSKSLSFVVDKTSPVMSFAGVEEGRFYNSDILPVITVKDANPKEKNVTLNGSIYTGSDITEEGRMELKVDAVDMAGNKSSLRRHFYIDKTFPVTTLQIGLPMITDNGKLSITGSTQVVLAASDSGTAPSGINRIEYGLDDISSWNIYKKSISLGSREGPHKIHYRSVDNAGNIEAAKEADVTVDNIAPVTQIHAGEPKSSLKGVSLLVSRDTEFTMDASDNISGVSKTEYRVNKGQWHPGPSFNIANEGRQIIEYRSIDRLGNTETARSLDVVVDNTAPVTAISMGSPRFSSSENKIFITGGTAITLAAMDALSEVAASEYRIDSGPWTHYAPLKIQAEGEHLVEYRSRDQMGNLEKGRSTTLIVDNSPPVSRISIGSPNFKNQDEILLATGKTSFAISASDNLSGAAETEYRIDGGAWRNYTVPFSIPTEGKHVIAYRSTDNTGNLESAQSLSIVIDNTPPVTAINAEKPRYEAGSAVFITGITAVSLNSTDNLAGVQKSEYRIDNGEWTAFNALIDLASLTDGKHSIGYRSSDNLGNLENEKLMMIVIDNTPPLAKINIGMPFYKSADGVNYITSQSSLTLNVTDDLCGVKKSEYRLDSGKWLHNAPFKISSGGSYLIESGNSDNLGNFEITRILSVTVDNSPPVTTIAPGSPRHDVAGAIFVPGKTEFILNVSDNLSGIKQTQYRINGGVWTVYEAAFNLKSLPDGKQTIGYRSVDNLGNLEIEKTLSIIVDNTTPSSSINISDPIYNSVKNISYITSETTFSLSAEDNLSGVKITEYRVDNGQWLPASTFRINSEGNHKIAYRSVDNVGNVETEKIISMTVDNTPPVTGIASKDLKYKAGGTIYATSKTEFYLSAMDNLSGVKETDYRIDISAWVTGTTKYTLSTTDKNPEVKVTEYKADSSAWITGSTLTLPIDGTHTIGYRSRDNIGHLETEKTLTVIIDNIPPYTTIDFSMKYNDGSNLLVSRNSQVTLNASDGLSGVKATYYRFDNLKDWHTYSGLFELSELSNGIHTIYYKTVDNVDNSENEKSITIKTIGRD